MTLEDACAAFLTYCGNEKKLSPLSVRAYRGDLSNLVRLVGADADVADMSEDWIEAAMQRWSSESGLKMISVKRRIACVKVFVRWLFRRRIIRSNPLERLHIEIRLPRRLPRNLQTAEIRQLVACAPVFPYLAIDEKHSPGRPSRDQWDRLTARMAIEVMTLTGVRVGELVKIRAIDINVEIGQIRVHGKGSKERHVSFPDQVTIERLQQYQIQAKLCFDHSTDSTLFLNGLGRAANEQYIRRVIRAFAESAELSRRVTPHMLRHTAATQLLEAGLDTRFVQKLLGHASITTTEIYTHVADHVLRAEISRADVRNRLEMHR